MSTSFQRHGHSVHNQCHIHQLLWGQLFFLAVRSLSTLTLSSSCLPSRPVSETPPMEEIPSPLRHAQPQDLERETELFPYTDEKLPSSRKNPRNQIALTLKWPNMTRFSLTITQICAPAGAPAGLNGPNTAYAAPTAADLDSTNDASVTAPRVPDEHITPLWPVIQTLLLLRCDLPARCDTLC